MEPVAELPVEMEIAVFLEKISFAMNLICAKNVFQIVQEEKIAEMMDVEEVVENASNQKNVT